MTTTGRTAEPPEVPQVTPSDFGLPSQFTDYRSNQAEVGLTIASAEKRVQVLDARTGSGKSAISMTVHQVHQLLLGANARTLYLVGTKGLQQQIVREFQSLGLVNVQGQGNYECVALRVGAELEGYGERGASCSDGPCKAEMYCSLKHNGGCLYYDTIREAAQSRLVVSNYSYWLTIGRHADPLSIGKFDLLVLDEAHTAPKWLSEHCTVKLKRDEVMDLLGLKLPPIDEGVAVWSSWAKEAAVIAGQKYANLKAEVDYAKSDGRGSRKGLMKKLLRMKSLTNDLDQLAQAHAWRNSEGSPKDVRMPGLQTDWVAELSDEGAKFTPVWAHPYAEQYLFRSTPKIVLSSATITPAITKYLGLDPEEVDWNEAHSPFDPKRSPVIYIPTTRVDKNMSVGDRRVLMNRVDRIIGARLDRNGIIATVSYERARMVMQNSKHAGTGLLVSHDSRSTQRTVEHFKRSTRPQVLVSPVMVEGFDFPGDECRYIIILKLPFADGRDPVERARRKSDKDWPNYNTALTLVQTCGRAMRSEDDWCEVFILDDHWKWFRKVVELPKWFQKMLKYSEVVPKPLKF